MQVVLLTGGAGGLARALADLVLTRGGRVWLCDLAAEAVTAAVSTLRAKHAEAGTAVAQSKGHAEAVAAHAAAAEEAHAKREAAEAAHQVCKQPRFSRFFARFSGVWTPI